MDGELTYGEVIDRRKNAVITEYTCEVESIVNDLLLKEDDVVNGILTNDFFMRKDISSIKKHILEDLTNRLKKRINSLEE